MFFFVTFACKMSYTSSVMNVFLTLRRPLIWLSRFRHRCGYGVHSPFAFDLITCVIYEKASYYAYKPLALEQQKYSGGGGSTKVNRLLFRLANWAQPCTMVDIGTLSASSLYLRAGKRGERYVSASGLSEPLPEVGVPVDFLYLHDFHHPQLVEDAFEYYTPQTTRKSVFVIEGIRYTKPMKKLWRQMQADERVGITFDLYDLGILFFDTDKIKQHYVVNF